MNAFKYVTIKKFAELCGLTEEAIRQYIKKGIWRQRVHWIKTPNGRILINIKGAEGWFEGTRG